nr:MAG TPA: hypothetical protein [Caudoviricetes sp.]
MVSLAGAPSPYHIPPRFVNPQMCISRFISFRFRTILYQEVKSWKFRS